MWTFHKRSFNNSISIITKGVKNESTWPDLRGVKELTLFITNQDVVDRCKKIVIDECTDWKTKRIGGTVLRDVGLSTECGKYTWH